MNDPTITCPQCKTEIKLTESLAAPLLESTRQQYEQRLLEQRSTIAAEETKKARQAIAIDLDQKSRDLADLQSVLKERDIKLAEAQKAQAELIRKQRQLDDAMREMELTIETRVQGSLSAVRDKAKSEAEEGLKLRVAEKEQTILSMQRQIEELKRRAEQGSQQIQGEVQELAIEQLLRSNFPLDSIDPVPKGDHGGDVLHRVCGPLGSICGTILWEVKRTKNWSNSWLAKLRDDQRAASAEFAILVSQTLPDGVSTFNLVDGIWVTSAHCALPMAVAIRHTIIEISAARLTSEGQQTKIELMYQYLTGPRFRHRIEAIVEKFADMQADLDKERKTMTRLWAKRTEQMRCVIESTAGMYGDLQGIAGRSLQEIAGLDVILIESEREPE